MRIAYNPVTAAALTTAPANNDITFDLRGLNIFVRGIKFKGTDTTYSVFKKHTSSEGGGYDGLVPVPSYTSTNIRFLREDGIWEIPTLTGKNDYIKLYNTDLNDLKLEGIWYYIPEGSNNINGPEGINEGSELYVGRNSDNYRYQKVITHNGIIWFRIWNTSSWESWRRWFVDGGTDNKVLQSESTTDNFRPIILGYNNDADINNILNPTTNLVYVSSGLYAKPNVGYLYANKLYSGGKEVLTEHQSLSDYVTISTIQTIIGLKTFSSPINSSYITTTYLGGNKGGALINSTSNAGEYVMLFKGNSINGFFTHGVYQDKYLLQYTAKTTVEEEINSVTKSITLLDESGNSYFPGSIFSNNLNLSGNIYFNTSSLLCWNNDTILQRLFITNDNYSGTSVFNFLQSLDDGNNWNTLTSIYDNGYIHANGFYKNGSSNKKVLLGDGSDKDLNDFMLKSEELTNNSFSINKILNVSTTWMNTGIEGNDLASGTYILLLYVNDDSSFYNTYHSGIISWYESDTDDSEVDEIILHRAGHAYNKTIYLRTVLASSGNGGMKLLIAASSDIGASIEYKFKFKRII